MCFNRQTQFWKHILSQKALLFELKKWLYRYIVDLTLIYSVYRRQTIFLIEKQCLSNPKAEFLEKKNVFFFRLKTHTVYQSINSVYQIGKPSFSINSVFHSKTKFFQKLCFSLINYVNRFEKLCFSETLLFTR